MKVSYFPESLDLFENINNRPYCRPTGFGRTFTAFHTILPKRLVVDGNLELNEGSIIQEGTIVLGDLYISEESVKKLPIDTIVLGKLYRFQDYPSYEYKEVENVFFFGGDYEGKYESQRVLPNIGQSCEGRNQRIWIQADGSKYILCNHIETELDFYKNIQTYHEAQLFEIIERVKSREDIDIFKAILVGSDKILYLAIDEDAVRYAADPCLETAISDLYYDRCYFHYTKK